MHINWLKNQICVLGCMLTSHARNGNEFQTPRHRWLPTKHWDAWFLNSSKSKTRLKFMKLVMLSWSGINMPCYKILSYLGQVWVYASHKPELLTTSMMIFGRERPTFGDETISVASYCFQKFSSVNLENQSVVWIFVIFRSSFGHFYALTKFSMHFCA